MLTVLILLFCAVTVSGLRFADTFEAPAFDPKDYDDTNVDTGDDDKFAAEEAEKAPADKADDAPAKEDKTESDKVEDDPKPAEEDDSRSEDTEGQNSEAPVGLDEELLERGKDLGFSDDEMKAQPDLVRRVAANEDKVIAAIGREKRARSSPPGPAEKPPEAPAEKEPAPKDEKSEKWEIDPELLNESGDYDPKIVKEFQKAQKTIASLETTVCKVTDFLDSQVAQASNQRTAGFLGRMDDLFADESVGGAYADKLGKGSINDLEPDSAEMKARAQVVGELNAMGAGYEATKRKVPSEKVLMRRALRVVFGDKSETTARDKINEDIKKRSGQVSARPTQEKGKPKSALQKAVAFNVGYRRDHGETTEPDETLAEDELGEL